MDDHARKRQKTNVRDNVFDTNANFVAPGNTTDREQRALQATTGPRAISNVPRTRLDPRNKSDRPKSKHVLQGFSPWVLVKTKLGRRFVHNLETKQSFWRIPQHLRPGIEVFNRKEQNGGLGAPVEEQKEPHPQPRPEAEGTDNGEDESRRRRSESLQREDEEAMLAELAAQAEHEEEQDAREANEAVADIEPRGYIGDASDSEYEYVEVTDDSQAEDDDEEPDETAQPGMDEENAGHAAAEEAAVEFGEDDIAYQLAMMGEEYGLDPGEYGDDEDVEPDDRGLDLSSEEARDLFFQMLEEHQVSPFTPWDKIISDSSDDSIIFDDRYTLLSSRQARKEAWDEWSRRKAAEIQTIRATEEKKDPRISYLTFLSTYASPKLYWPEFKRKHRKEPVLSDRSLQDKDREKLYRDFIAKLKLPEPKRRQELQASLKSMTGKKEDSDAISKQLLVSTAFHALQGQARQDLLQAFNLIDPTAAST